MSIRLPVLLLLTLALGAGEALAIAGDRIHADAVRIGPLEFTDVTGRVAVGDGRTGVSRMKGKAYGGTVRGQVQVDDKGTKLLLIVQDMDLGLLMTGLGAGDELGGKVDGEVVLVFLDNPNDRVRGGGTLRITRGSIITIPFLAELLLGNVLADKGQDEVVVEFALENNRVTLNRIEAKNPSIHIKGAGEIDFTGRINVVLTPTTKPAFVSPFPIIGDALGWALGKLSGVVGRFEIVGHVGAPVFRPKLL